MDMILCIGVDVSSRTFEASLGARAAEIVAADPCLKARFDALTSIPGVGRQTALVL
jgi:endonuclease III